MKRDLHFKQLFNNHYRELCLFATHFTADIAQAEDLVQDSFMRLWEKVHKMVPTTLLPHVPTSLPPCATPVLWLQEPNTLRPRATRPYND